jgi:release factor glutamine methyltransferase
VTIRQALGEAYGVLTAGGVDTPVLDATILLSYALGVTKERLVADLPETVGPDVYAAFRRFLALRLQGIPVSYIRRRKEFYGLEFLVDERVLVPRPDTEALVEAAIEQAGADVAGAAAAATLHDTCTGSGCVAIACAFTLPDLAVSVSDVSPAALEVCAANSRALLGRELPAVRSDLLSGVSGRFDLITANPPYLTDLEMEGMRDRRWPEPELALAGGPDGTAVSRRLAAEARAHLAPGGSLLMEMAPPQAGALWEELERLGYEGIRVYRDLAGRDRVLAARAPHEGTT